MQKFTLAAIAALMAAAPAFAAPAQADDWLPEAQRINREIVRQRSSDARELQLFNGKLAQNRSQNHTIQLQAGKSYVFFADCDRQCSDIDLKLTDSNGKTIKEDNDDDDSPIFGWRANRTGSYTLTVTMPKCDTEQCEYSSQVFMGTKPVFDH